MAFFPSYFSRQPAVQTAIQHQLKIRRTAYQALIPSNIPYPKTPKKANSKTTPSIKTSPSISLSSISIPEEDYLSFELLEDGSYGIKIKEDAKTVPTSIRIPNVHDNIEITEILPNAFSYLHVTKIEFPNSIRKIGENAFEETDVEEINISDSVTQIDSCAFMDCKKLRKVTLPSQLEEIEVGLFSGCEMLEEITIPNTIKEIKQDAFSKTAIRSIKIPDQVKEISTQCFDFCTNLTDVTLSQNLETISKSAFFRCTSLTSILLPDKVKRIEEFAFESCTKLASVVLPDGLEYLGSRAFSFCTNLKKVTFPEPCQYGGYCFEESGLNVRDENGLQYIGDNKNPYFLIDGLKNKNQTDFILNSSAKAIGMDVFRESKVIESIVFPQGFNVISEYSFYECENLKAVTLKDGIKIIGDRSFCKCYKLEKIDLYDSISYLGNGALGYTAIKTAHIPNTLTVLPKSLFSTCKNLTKIILGENIETIDDWAFSGCSGLAEIQIPETIKSIGSYVFSYTHASKVFIPSSVTELKEKVFWCPENPFDLYLEAATKPENRSEAWDELYNPNNKCHDSYKNNNMTIHWNQTIEDYQEAE